MSGADTFVLNQPAGAAPAAQVAGYAAAQGDIIDLSALTANASDSLLVRVAEDSSDAFASLEVNTAGAQGAQNWFEVAQLEGVHSGDAVNFITDPTHSVAQLQAAIYQVSGSADFFGNLGDWHI